jgi:type IV secretory pathway VirB10-like protein
VAATRAIMSEEDAEEAEEVAAEEASTIVSSWKQLNISIVEKKINIPPTAPHQERITLGIQTWYPKRISKIHFNLL